MSIHCTDGEIPDDELSAWNAGPLDVRLPLPCAQVRAVFAGSCLARGIALLELTAGQVTKLFPRSMPRKSAWALRRFAARLTGARVRAALALAPWHQLRAASLHETEEAQIRAALSHALRPSRPRRPRAA